MKLIDACKEHVPNTTDFNVGYYEGHQHLKVWLVTNDDLNSMYMKYHNGGDIVLWCDGKSENEIAKAKRKKGESNVGSTRHEKEDEVDNIYADLKEKHSTKFDTPKLRLWARMVAQNLHDDYDNPPNIPAFSGSSKKPRKDNMYEALTGAAEAFAKVVTSTSTGDQHTCTTPSSSMSTGRISPSKSIELRMKNFEQLRYLQQLFDDGILNDKEYTEQKENIISSLRKLSAE